MNDPRQELRERIMQMLVRYDVFQGDMIQDLELILGDFEINSRRTEVMVIDEDENQTLIRKFITAKIVKGLSDRTIKYYKETIDFFLLRVQKNIKDVTSDDIRLYTAIRLKKDKVTSTTAGNELRNLRSFYNWLQTEELIKRNPMAKIEPIKKEKIQKEAFTEDEVELIRAACASEMEAAIVEVLLSTGCRVGELVKMERQDITGETILVHGKGRKDRFVYLNARARIALGKYMSERSDEVKYIFPKSINATSSQKMKKVRREWFKHADLIADGVRDVSGIEKTIKEIGRRAKVDNVHPHRFRRTCATLALRRGMPIEQVSKMLGHEQLSTTQIYLDLSEEEVKQTHRKYVI